MENRELIRHLINFDEDIDGVDPSTGFNSISGDTGMVEPEDSEDLFRQMVRELGAGWEYGRFERQNHLDMYGHVINHKAKYDTIKVSVIARYLKRCPGVYINFVPASVTLEGCAKDIELVFPHIVGGYDSGVSIHLLEGDTIRLGEYMGVPFPEFLSLNYFDKRYDSYSLIGMGDAVKPILRTCIQLPYINRLGADRTFNISRFKQLGYTSDDLRSKRKVEITQYVEERVKNAFWDTNTTADDIPKFNLIIDDSSIHSLDISGAWPVDIKSFIVNNGNVNMLKTRGGGTTKVMGEKAKVSRLIRQGNKFLKGIKDVTVKV